MAPRVDQSSKRVYEERITFLPQDVLENILFRLSTEEIVRTSVLSKTWRRIWTCLRSFFLEDSIFSSIGEERRLKFFEFVQNVIRQCSSPKIDNFSLVLHHNYHQPSVQAWLDSVLRRGVERLSVRYRYGRFPFPSAFFACHSLAELDLVLPTTLELPVLTTLPRLKTLNLSKVILANPDGNKSREVEFDFPSLIEFTMLSCFWEDIKSVHFRAPKLSSFHMLWSKFELGDNNFAVESFSVNLGESTSLKIFNCAGYFIEKFELPTRSSLSRASLDHIIEVHNYRPAGLGAGKLLKNLISLTHLEISIDAVEAMEKSGALYSISVLYHVTSIKVVSRFTGSTRALMELLRKTPNLTTLDINLVFQSSLYWKYDDADLLEGSLPECVTRKLKKLFFTFRFGRPVSLYLTKMLMKDAKKLELCQVMAPDIDEMGKLEITAQLMMTPKAAEDVAIEVLP